MIVVRQNTYSKKNRKNDRDDLAEQIAIRDASMVGTAGALGTIGAASAIGDSARYNASEEIMEPARRNYDKTRRNLENQRQDSWDKYWKDRREVSDKYGKKKKKVSILSDKWDNLNNKEYKELGKLSDGRAAIGRSIDNAREAARDLYESEQRRAARAGRKAYNKASGRSALVGAGLTAAATYGMYKHSKNRNSGE